jgi:hypothetical protein
MFGTVTRLGAGRQRNPSSILVRDKRCITYLKRPDLSWSSQPSVKWLPSAYSPEQSGPGCEADHSPSVEPRI